MDKAQLLAMLTATAERDGIYWPDGWYIDWSSKTADGRSIEIGDGDNAVVINRSWSEIEQLHKALTVLLLEERGE